MKIPNFRFGLSNSRILISDLKALLLSAITFLASTTSWGQQEEKRFVSTDLQAFTVRDSEHGGSFAPKSSRSVFFKSAAAEFSTAENRLSRAKSKIPDEVEITKCCDGVDKTGVGVDAAGDIPDVTPPKEKFHWKPALTQSLVFLAFKHSVRIAREDKTRRELGGPFFRDWGRSVKNLRGWRDGDSFVTNYIGHPMQGAFTGRIFINNSDNAKKQEFGANKKYWRSRAKALAWSAVWSAQFELGPISEATIGNVGLNMKGRYSTMAYVDLVVTPLVGTGVVVGEDAIDKYVLKKWLERKSNNKLKIRLLRSFLTPTTSLANLLRGKTPWKRDYRPL